MSEILIKNATLLTMNENFDVLKGANLLIKDSLIAYVGADLPQSEPDAQIIDANGAIVMPGLVNTHNHLPMTFFRSYASDLPLDKWLQEIWKIEDRLDDEYTYYGAAVACIEALESGTACVNDLYMFMDGVAQACEETGIRAYLSRCVVDMDNQLTKRLNQSRDFYLKWNGKDNGRLSVVVGPHAEYTCSKEALLALLNQAKELNTRLHLHACETVKEVAECRQRHGMSPIEYFNSLGLFEVPAILAHCVVLSNKDMDIMADKNVSVAHNPGSNLKLASGIAPIPQLLDKGVNVAMGTDGNGSNNNLDMFRELYLCSVLHKGANRNATAVSAKEALSIATVNGAKALGYKGGVLKAGSVADVIMLKKSVTLYPEHDLFGIICYSAGAKDVDINIVNGRIVVKDGKCQTVNRDSLINEFLRRTEKLFAN